MGQGWSVQRNTYYTGKTAQRIAKESGVVFEKGTLKKIKKVDGHHGAGGLSHGTQPTPDDYEAILSDGTEIRYEKQLPANKSRIKVTGNKVSIFGIDGMHVLATYDKASSYDVYGCCGFLNVGDNRRNDTVKTHPRKLPSGQVQSSYMLVHHDDKDVFVKTKNDKRYIGN